MKLTHSQIKHILETYRHNLEKWKTFFEIIFEVQELNRQKNQTHNLT